MNIRSLQGNWCCLLGRYNGRNNCLNSGLLCLSDDGIRVYGRVMRQTCCWRDPLEEL